LTALSTLRTDAATFGGNSTLIQTRQDFTANLINSLQSASSDLIAADTNTEGANLQALQAQDQLGIVSLGVSGTLAQAILKIL
jgi:flagellin-like hook-associated protein FlgL